nr:hypothetical protein [uncultured Draconibacterium sp.]
METIKQTECRNDKSSSWIIGGTTMLGLGIGFFVLHTSAKAFVGCIMVGIGIGLMISSLINKNH